MSWSVLQSVQPPVPFLSFQPVIQINVWESFFSLKGTDLSSAHSKRWTGWRHARYIWRELCIYLCNCVIQTSRSHVTMFKIRRWDRGGWGMLRLGLPLYLHYTKTPRQDSHWNCTSLSTTCLSLVPLWKLLIKNSIYGTNTSPTAVQINFEWAVSQERVLLSHRFNSIKRQK